MSHRFTDGSGKEGQHAERNFRWKVRKHHIARSRITDPYMLA